MRECTHECMRGILLRGLLFRQAFSCKGILVYAFGDPVKPHYLFDGDRFQAPFLPSCLSSPKKSCVVAKVDCQEQQKLCRSICDSRWVSRPAHRCSRTGLEVD